MPKIQVAPLPHSWPVSEWPAHVFPNRQSSATHLVRAHRKELLRLRALERVGRTLIMYGTGYAEFLASQSGRVEGYDVGEAGLAAAKLKLAQGRGGQASASGEAA